MGFFSWARDCDTRVLVHRVNFTNAHSRPARKKAFYLEKAIVQNSQHMLGGGRSACVWAVFQVCISDLTELSNFYCYPLECCFLF